jgi:hypothetical protein
MSQSIQNVRSQKGVSELSQFPVVLYIVFLIVLFPLLNLVTLFVAGTTLYLATNDFAAKAATQVDYSSALNCMVNEAFQFQSNGLAHFVHMVPEGGYTGSGDDLYVLATNIKSGAVTSSPADGPLTQQIDTATSMYELQVKSTYSVSPLLSLASIPVLGTVPGLGTPVTLTFTASRPVEHPGGLQATAGGSSSSGGAVTPFARVTQANNTGANQGVWRTPDIFEKIKAAGQTVVSVNVILVYANLPWQNSSVANAPGQNVWIDTQAVGIWGDGGQSCDANGYPGATEPVIPETASVDIAPGGQFAELVGYVGTPPAIVQGQNGAVDPKMFYVGNTLLNYQLPGAGMLWFVDNDSRKSIDLGAQMVRIIITAK